MHSFLVERRFGLVICDCIENGQVGGGSTEKTGWVVRVEISCTTFERECEGHLIDRFE